MQKSDESLDEILCMIEADRAPFYDLFDGLRNIAGSNLNAYLNQYYESKIKLILESALNKSFAELDETWLVLESIQVVLCKFLYKAKLQLSSSLEDFVRDFDRIDDPQMKAVVFERLQRKELSYA